MADNTVYSALQQVTGFSGDEISVFLTRVEEKNLQKKTTILSCGKVAKEIYFIISGCMRLYYDRDGIDISAFFFTENMFAGAYDSFTTKTKSRHFIETMEDCHCLSINYNNLQSLYLELPKMNELIRKILEKRFFELHQLFTSQILDSPEERYLHLLKEHPGLLQRIPQHHIATFLGATCFIKPHQEQGFKKTLTGLLSFVIVLSFARIILLRHHKNKIFKDGTTKVSLRKSYATHLLSSKR